MFWATHFSKISALLYLLSKAINEHTFQKKQIGMHCASALESRQATQIFENYGLQWLYILKNKHKIKKSVNYGLQWLYIVNTRGH
jgi:rhodanese-related sulfurtransferase